MAIQFTVTDRPKQMTEHERIIAALLETMRTGRALFVTGADKALPGRLNRTLKRSGLVARVEKNGRGIYAWAERRN